MTLSFLSLLHSSPAAAKEVYAWEVQSAEGALRAATHAGGAKEVTGDGCNCDLDETSAAYPQCSALTDDLCDSLWSDKNKGHIEVSDGSIRVGKSAKSEMAYVDIVNLQALVDAEERLPEDLRAKVKPILADLKKALAMERDSKEWYRSLSQIIDRWNTAIVDIGEERTERKHPDLQTKKASELTTEEKALYNADQRAIEGQVLDAKYAKHPNWQRVERVFKEVQEDLIAEVREMKISDAEKEERIGRLKTVRLSLPYSAFNFPAHLESCGSTTMNAVYLPANQVFTVCAGYFNSFQSDSALYGTIAHEVSHSIDAGRNADREFKKQSPVFNVLAKLSGASGPTYACEDWEKLTAELKAAKAPATPRKFDSLQPLYDCVQPKDRLEPFSMEVAESAAKRTSKEIISSFATDHAFLSLAQPTVTKDGKVQPNEFYMRPDRMTAKHNKNQFLNVPNREANPNEIFTQAYACARVQGEGRIVSYQTASGNERKRVFDKAVAETETLLRAQVLDRYTYCGVNCRDLAGEGISTDPSENTADWMTYRAMTRRLARLKTLREKRESAALSTVDLCEAPGPVKDAPDLAEEEKKFSLEVHPDTRVRRISVFNKKNAEIAKCRAKEQEQGFGLCEL